MRTARSRNSLLLENRRYTKLLTWLHILCERTRARTHRRQMMFEMQLVRRFESRCVLGNRRRSRRITDKFLIFFRFLIWCSRWLYRYTQPALCDIIYPSSSSSSYRFSFLFFFWCRILGEEGGGNDAEDDDYDDGSGFFSNSDSYW